MNGAAHRLIAAAAISVTLGHHEQKAGRVTPWPLVGGAFGAVCTAIPDYLEPALHPNHRQFFHSVAFAGVLIYGFRRLYEWNVKTPSEELARKLGMIGIGAYLIHLACDATTPKSLPWLGK